MTRGRTNDYKLESERDQGENNETSVQEGDAIEQAKLEKKP
jgi:hypothetical protein